MKNINFIKNIDNLGRIVIPMDVRKKMNINTGDILSITCDDEDIILRKYSSIYDNKIIEIIKCFVDNLNIKVILTDKEKVLYSNLLDDQNYILNKEMKLMVCNGYKIRNEERKFVFDNKEIAGCFNMLPIVSNEGIAGALIIMGDVFDKSYEICDLITKIIALELNIS